MALELTPAETRAAEEFAAHMDRRARRWRWSRWFFLALAAGTIASAAAACLPFAGGQDADPYESLLSQLYAGPPSGAEYVEFKLAVQRLRFLHQGATAITALTGVWLLAWTLSRWRRHRRDALIARILRAELAGRASSPEGP